MIDHSKKFVFIEIPKTGTTSIGAVLKKQCNIEKPDNYSLLKYKHNKPINIQKTFASQNLDLENYFKFTFVRNPFDLKVSTFHFVFKSLREYERNKSRFARLKIEYNPPHINWIKKCYKIRDNCKSFKEFVKFTNCADITVGVQQYNFAYYENKKFVNFVGKFERIQEDFNFLCNKIGIKSVILPKKNTTNHKHYTKYYDDETKQIVAEQYAKDIEYFGYEFGG